MNKKIFSVGNFLLLTFIIVSCDVNKPIENNTLRQSEIDEGWQLLFDGKTTNGWHKFNESSINGSWMVENGELIALGKGGDIGGDIVSENEFENFDLRLEWKISPEGNSGIFYGVVETNQYKALYYTGPEYQLIDDIGFPSELEEWQKTGADYAMYFPNKNKKLNKVGEWNSSRIVVLDSLVHYYLNGEKTVEFKRWTKDWNRRKAEGKWNDFPEYGMHKRGKIGLQDHGNKIWFRNIKIKSL